MIAAKTGFSEHYLKGILKLLDHGEERVLDAVLHGRLPITIAVQISGEDDEAAQRMLAEAYEKKAMKQATLRAFRQLLDQRCCLGKGYVHDARYRARRRTTADGLK
jgi:ParB family chromosome partitioning protein